MLKSAISHDLMGVGRTMILRSGLKLRLGLLLLMGAGLLVACSGDEKDPNGGETPVYVNDPSTTSFNDITAAGLTGNTFTIETNSTATVPASLTTSDESMITNLNAARSVQDATNGIYLWTVTFNVSANDTFEPRSATVSITIDGFTKTVNVSQIATAWNSPPVNTYDGLTNCYRIAPGGSVTIPITRAITIGGLSAPATATPEILWDDNSVITGSPTLSGSGASRTITVTASSTQGNAVIALKDAAGSIYWSWHIWVTTYDPNTGATWTNPNNTAYTFMDRNLGATDNQLNLVSRGLFYQWGRKDPFPGGKAGMAGYAALNSFNGLGTAIYVTNTSADVVGIADGILESIRKPTTFYSTRSEAFGDWLPKNENTLWNATGNKKSVYDPCPAGWRVPTSGEGTVSPWYGLTGQTWTEHSDTGGADWGMNAKYPAAGLHGYGNGDYNDSGRIGRYWSASAITIYGNYLYFNYYGETKTSVGGHRANAFSVRCVQE
jgi:hypothetical protein